MAKASVAGEPTYVLELSQIEAQALADLTACVSSQTTHGASAMRVYEALEAVGFYYRDLVYDEHESSLDVIVIKDNDS